MGTRWELTILELMMLFHQGQDSTRVCLNKHWGITQMKENPHDVKNALTPKALAVSLEMGGLGRQSHD